MHSAVMLRATVGPTDIVQTYLGLVLVLSFLNDEKLIIRTRCEVSDSDEQCIKS